MFAERMSTGRWLRLAVANGFSNSTPIW